NSLITDSWCAPNQKLKILAVAGAVLGLSLASAEGTENPMKRLPANRDEPLARPITFRAAEDLGPFDLAKLWVDTTVWPVDRRSQYDELAELAIMSALAKWLCQWQPIAIHG